MEVVPPGLGWLAVVATPSTTNPEPRMDAHENARTTPLGRMLMVERLRSGWSQAEGAAAMGVTARTARTWRHRFAAEGEAGLRDRSSRPHRSPARLAAAAEAEIAAPRRQRLSGPAIARQLGRPVSTVGAALRRLGLGQLAALDPPRKIHRYERERPGELIHIDTKKLGRIDGIGHRITGDRTGQSRKRGTGWEFLHVAVDDASRLAYTALMPDEKKESAVRFLEDALAWFTAHGVTVERAMTDDGSAYRSRLFAGALQARGLTHKRTRPCTPRTNGKAERFIQTSLREWAYANAFHSSTERARAMPAWLRAYNTSRPHTALGGKPPISRLQGKNLLGSNINRRIRPRRRGAPSPPPRGRRPAR
jgi:transposase InsO family protein